MGTFAAAIERETTLVYDLRVTMGGERRYFIVKVKPALKQAFLRAIAADKGYTLEDFGEVLHRGWNEPNETLKAELHERYGMYSY